MNISVDLALLRFLNRMAEEREDTKGERGRAQVMREAITYPLQDRTALTMAHPILAKRSRAYGARSIP
ncbi:MAG: hypothetical protein MUC98_02910, partial [Desulfobacterota bacterium]|nr:hypothetical protein [Thermodesulfobacteriota bacterium]